MKRKGSFLKEMLFAFFVLLVFSSPCSCLGDTFCVNDATELQSALTTAACNGEDDIVQIVQGTYSGNFVYASVEDHGVRIEGGYTYDCESRNVNPENTVLDGDTTGNVMVLSSPDRSADFFAEGLTFQNGKTADSNKGGGLFAMTDGSISLVNNVICENSAGKGGGGVYANSPNNTVTLTENIITENSADAYGGGAAKLYGSSVILTNNTITDNSAEGYGGGGVWAWSFSTVTFNNNTITGNLSENGGGGVYVSGRTAVTMTSNTITGNVAKNGVNINGGGVHISSSPTVTLASNTITQNSSESGGGVWISGSGDNKITIANNLIDKNSAKNGGGLYLSNLVTTIKGNTIIGNSAESAGGGIYSLYSKISLINNILGSNSAGSDGGGLCALDITVVMINNTTRNNAAENGGGIYFRLSTEWQEASIYNNIVYNNNATAVGNDLYIINDGNGDFVPSNVSLYNNDFDQSQSGTYIEIPFAIDPSNLDNADPLFVGGSDYHLTESSPCINTGDNNAPDLPSTDKDGNTRIIGGTVDMGVYEFGAAVYVSPDGLCGGKIPCYSSIQAGVDAANSGAAIKIVQGTYSENLTFDSSNNLTIQGGWDSSFTTQSSNTVINSLTIEDTSGTVEVENMILQ